MNQEYINTKQVSQLLGLPQSTMKRFRKQPKKGPPWTRIGSLIRYNVREVRDWMIANQNSHKRDTGAFYGQ